MSYFSSPLSPPRPSSRASIRSNNGRSQSPIVTLQDESVAIRTQMSTLKHTIRQHQAQLHSLENTLLRGPRPLPPGILNSPPALSPSELDSYMSISPPYSPPNPGPSSYPSNGTPKLQKRNSFEVLSSLAGPDSSLPLPRRDSRGNIRPQFGVNGLNGAGEENGIKEGIPMGMSPSKRASSPTRTLSSNARALAEDASPTSHHSQTLTIPSTSSSTSRPYSPNPLSSASSPNKRSSFAPGNTTKVLADLQAGVLNAKNALENTKGQLRLSQRQVSQLTRQVEDLKEVRERLRLENEGLNNVVARKERLLQEVLDRARKAEAEVVALKSQLKSETSTSKKTIRDMETALSESNSKSLKSEREYVTLKDSLKHLTEQWKRDCEGLREEMKRREEKVRKEGEEVGKKYVRLVEKVKKEREQGGATEVKRLVEEHERVRREMEDGFKAEVEELKKQVEKSGKDSEEAAKTAKYLAEELSRLRRMMRASVSQSSIPVPVVRPPTSPSSGAPP